MNRGIIIENPFVYRRNFLVENGAIRKRKSLPGFLLQVLQPECILIADGTGKVFKRPTGFCCLQYFYGRKPPTDKLFALFCYCLPCLQQFFLCCEALPICIIHTKQFCDIFL